MFSHLQPHLQKQLFCNYPNSFLYPQTFPQPPLLIPSTAPLYNPALKSLPPAPSSPTSRLIPPRLIPSSLGCRQLSRVCWCRAAICCAACEAGAQGSSSG